MPLSNYLIGKILELDGSMPCGITIIEPHPDADQPAEAFPLWSVCPVTDLRDMIVEWADVCEGCANEARRAMDMAQQVGALRFVLISCAAEIGDGQEREEYLEHAAEQAAQGQPWTVACVDGDGIIVLPDDEAIDRFIAWCRENVTW